MMIQEEDVDVERMSEKTGWPEEAIRSAIHHSSDELDAAMNRLFAGTTLAQASVVKRSVSFPAESLETKAIIRYFAKNFFAKVDEFHLAELHERSEA